MFVAKFSQMKSDKVEADTNGNMPYIGEVVSGKSRGTFINGTIFQNEGLKTNALYACENVDEEYEGKPQVRVQILAEVSIMDFIQLKKELGAPSLTIASKEVEVEEEVAFE